MYNPKITIKGEEFNSRNTLVIAEMANAHDGNVEIAKKIIKASADGGANAVKVQRIHIMKF
jgi:sialic acid synthase SpsE